MNNRDGDAFDRVHPDFVDLMFRVGIDPPINPPSEDAMARSIHLAIQMADAYEQAELVSRIVPEEELAARRLADRDFRNLDHRITLDAAERLAALRNTPEPERQVERRVGNLGECLICGEEGHVRVPCNCVYCHPCLRELIRRGLTGLTEFPPRCCVQFREETIRLAQRPELVHLFRQLQEENEVPVPDRLYCHDPHCAAFIPLDYALPAEQSSVSSVANAGRRATANYTEITTTWYLYDIDQKKKTRPLFIDCVIGSNKEVRKRLALLMDRIIVDIEKETTRTWVLLIDSIVDIKKEIKRRQALIDNIVDIKKDRKKKQVLLMDRAVGRTLGTMSMKDHDQI
ncbi:hypothetical protein CEP51_005112 [Fusarium floridanum]|uniref:IBR domain-containing protein n=1 Tax=Fusarium floridanum TaxID=1325733 RepID=A0A428RYD7_9HYPO|nr:hypothetical protein CEP51_005112 [Fusarium floridanum]